MQTGLMGAMRPQSPHRSPRQAFGGNFKPAPKKKLNSPKEKNLNDYMPVFRGLFHFRKGMRRETESRMGGRLRRIPLRGEHERVGFRFTDTPF
jgi:hypothetical protein